MVLPLSMSLFTGVGEANHLSEFPTTNLDLTIIPAVVDLRQQFTANFA